MKSVLVRLRESVKEASPTERGIIEYILKNPRDIPKLTIYQLAEKTFSSPSSIIRMCKKNDFTGYKDFTKALIYELAIRDHTKRRKEGEIISSDSIEGMVEEITYKNIVSLEDTRRIMDVQVVEKSIELIGECDNLCIFGIGSSLIVAKDAQQKFLRLNKSCIVSEDWHLQLLTARNMSPRDLGIIVSYSGQTREMIECARAMKENQVKIISISKYGSSPIVELADYNIFIAANESTFRSGAMSSRISQLNVIDILYTGYASSQYEKSLELIARTHIKKEDKDGNK